MRNETRLLFTAYVSQIALLNSVADATVKFSVAPVVEQKLEEKIQESSEFLSQINIVGVPEQSGQKASPSRAHWRAAPTPQAARAARPPIRPTPRTTAAISASRPTSTMRSNMRSWTLGGTSRNSRRCCAM